MSGGPSPGDDARFDVWYRFVSSDGRIDHDEWVRACNSGEFVGMCRSSVVTEEDRPHSAAISGASRVHRRPCAGQLIPARPVVLSARRTDYEAYCSQCGHVVVSPMGKTRYYSNWPNDHQE